jgi:hypothetical protein
MRSIWWAALAATILGSSPAFALNTHAVWDGSTSIYAFGCPDTSNYGQTVTVPKFKHTLRKVVYYLGGSGAGSLTVRAELYQWDSVNHRPTGSAIYESDPKTVSFSGPFQPVTFTPNASVSPGVQYVIFLTVDKDYEQCASSYTLGWEAVADSTYTGGTFVYLNDAGNYSDWETEAWTDTYGNDLAFKILFSTAR